MHFQNHPDDQPGWCRTRELQNVSCRERLKSLVEEPIEGLGVNVKKLKSTLKMLHPEVYYIRQTITELQEKRGIFMAFDFHGHSKK